MTGAPWCFTCCPCCDAVSGSWHAARLSAILGSGCLFLLESFLALSNSLPRAFCLCLAALFSALDGFFWTQALVVILAAAAKLAD